MNIKLELSFDTVDDLLVCVEKLNGTVAPSVPTVPAPVPMVAPSVPTVPAPVPTLPPQQPTPGGVAAAVHTITPPEATPASAPPPEVSSAANSYSLDDLRRAGAELVDMGKQAELPGLLTKFGIQSLPDLPQERYNEFAAALRELGARI